MNRTTALVAAAAILLAAGLAGPLQRHFGAPADPAKAQQKRLEAEEAELRRELVREREGIVATMRERLANGDPHGAMKAGARYHALGDPEINGLYGEAAQRVGFQQRIDEVRRIIGAKCTPLAARIAAAQFMRNFARVDEKASLDGLVLARLPDADARPAILAVVAKPRSAAAGGDDPLSRAHAFHRARVHDYDAIALQLEPLPEGIVCAWRAKGPVSVEGRRRDVTLDFWLAPMPAGQSLDFEVLAYSAR